MIGVAHRPGLRDAAFVVRCAASATLASLAAQALGLGHPVWAVVSSLIVSQDSVAETRRSLLWRVAATVIGLAIAILLSRIAATLALGLGASVAGAVLLAAGIARLWPMLRVCMWTAPLVLMTATPAHSILHTAIERGSEVVIGAAIAATVHISLDLAVSLLSRSRK